MWRHRTLRVIHAAQMERPVVGADAVRSAVDEIALGDRM
jgi:hypothetical protein